MPGTDDTPFAPPHRHPQEAVDDLARMGIDPVTLGLPPASTSDTTAAAATVASESSDPPDDAAEHAAADSTQDADPQPGGHGPGVPPDSMSDSGLVIARAPWEEPTAALDRAIDFDHAPFQAPVRHANGPAGRAYQPAHPDDPDDRTSETEPTEPVVAPTGARRAVSAFSAGLFTARSAQRIQDEQDIVAGVRAPQREHQVVTFVAGKGGVGTTTTTAGVALAMASLRDDHVALIDAQAGTDSLQRWLSDSIASGPPGLRATSDEPASYPLLQLSNGLDVVDGAPWQAPADPTDLTAIVGQLRQGHTFTLVDVGNDVGATAHQMLAASTRVVVVTAADRHAARATQLVLSRIHQVQPARLADVVVAVVCLVRGQYRRVLRELRSDLGSHASLVVPVPHEPVLAAADHLDLGRLHPQSREAYLRVAAALAGPRLPSPVIRSKVPAPLWTA
jgi:MinD-like ATPase involved in chromosome partitioning or flagellar assembly